jgi:hypothetical protein
MWTLLSLSVGPVPCLDDLLRSIGFPEERVALSGLMRLAREIHRLSPRQVCCEDGIGETT